MLLRDTFFVVTSSAKLPGEWHCMVVQTGVLTLYAVFGMQLSGALIILDQLRSFKDLFVHPCSLLLP